MIIKLPDTVGDEIGVVQLLTVDGVVSVVLAGAE